MFYFGFHHNNPDKVQKVGANMIQIFSSKHFKPIKDLETVVHAPYYVNLAVANNNILKKELEFANTIRAYGLVIHVGKQLQLTKEKAIDNMVTTLRLLIRDAREKNIKILLETPAGQGTELLVNLDELSLFYQRFSEREKNTLKICVDTCHIFSAGYDIRRKDQVDKYFEDFNKKIGIKNLGLIHLNDSKRELNSHVDRHERINKGTIGKKGLQCFVLYGYKYNIPVILETPNNGFLIEIPWIKSIIQKYKIKRNL